jgi:hypothetical protein
MVLGRLKREMENKQMINLAPAGPPPESLGDLVKAMSALVTDPKAGKKFLADLLAGIDGHKAAAAEHRAEQQKLHELKEKTADELHDAKTRHHADLDKSEAASAARLLARETAVTAREKAATAREAAAEEKMTKANEREQAVKRRVAAFDAA